MSDRSPFAEALAGGAFAWLLLCGALIVVAVVIGDYAGILGKIALAGAWAGYFTAAFAAAEPGTRLSPPSLEIQDALVRSASVAALAAALIGGPLWLLSSHAADITRADRAAVEAALARDEAGPPPEPERVDEHARWREGLRARLGRLDEERAADALSRAAKGQSMGPEGTPPPTLRAPKVLAAVLLAFLGLLYLPAALALAAATTPANLFLPTAVFHLAIRGGAPYVIAALAGVALSFGPALFAVLAGTSAAAVPEVLLGGPWLAAYRYGQRGVRDAFVLILLWSAGTTYAAGVTGVLLGRLVEDRPDLLPDDEAG